MTTKPEPLKPWLKKPGELYDCRGVPIYPGDLLRSYHFTGARGKKFYLYHTAYMHDGAMRMKSTSELEPTLAGRGGDCLLSQELADNAEVIYGYGPEPYLDYTDRPRVARLIRSATRTVR